MVWNCYCLRSTFSQYWDTLAALKFIAARFIVTVVAEVCFLNLAEGVHFLTITGYKMYNVIAIFHTRTVYLTLCC